MFHVIFFYKYVKLLYFIFHFLYFNFLFSKWLNFLKQMIFFASINTYYSVRPDVLTLSKDIFHGRISLYFSLSLHVFPSQFLHFPFHKYTKQFLYIGTQCLVFGVYEYFFRNIHIVICCTFGIQCDQLLLYTTVFLQPYIIFASCKIFLRRYSGKR